MIDDQDLLKTQSVLNVVPMIDIFLLLLIFFMVSTTFGQMGVSVKQPESHSVSPITAHHETIVITKKVSFLWVKIR